LKVVGIIPSRLESSRLARKPLVDIEGLPMIIHVYLRCLNANTLDDIFVATDSKEIADVVSLYGGKYIMTSKDHKTGTDRIAEAAEKIDCDIVVNIQGDEALVDPSHIDLVVNSMLKNNDLDIALLVSPCNSYNSPSHIKTVVDESMNVMYFSRSDIPSSARHNKAPMLKGYHIVPFRKNFLLDFASWEHGKLEDIEYCEYLRILEKGFKIKAVFINYDAVSVDDKETLLYVRDKMKSDPIFKTYSQLVQQN
jgi:3-deoxy-manno-octulosonate cytidylyltransferase (CMP-KDO synthetase)